MSRSDMPNFTGSKTDSSISLREKQLASQWKRFVTKRVLLILRGVLTADEAGDQTKIIWENDKTYEACAIYLEAESALENEKWYCGSCMRFKLIDEFSDANKRNIVAKKYAYCPDCTLLMNNIKPSAVKRIALREEKKYSEDDMKEMEERIKTSMLNSYETAMMQDEIVEEENIEEEDIELESIMEQLKKYRAKLKEQKVKYSYVEIVIVRNDPNAQKLVHFEDVVWSVASMRYYTVLSAYTQKVFTDEEVKYMKDIAIAITME
jgi:hypothetical protein